MTQTSNEEQSLKKEPLKPFLIIKENSIEVNLPLLTVSEANGGVKRAFKSQGKTIYKSEHWRDKHARHKQQKRSVTYILRPHTNLLTMPCHIKLTRYAPHKLDRHDNLPMSMKYILDAICEVITGDYRPGRADSDERISVSYDQIVSKDYGINILIMMENIK